MRWHAHHHTEGTGHLYQGRFKTFPIEEDEHLLTVLRYVEGNALRANLCERAEDWRWCSLWRRKHASQEEGDFLAFLNAGGYGASMSSNHCMRGGFSEYLILNRNPKSDGN